MSDTPTPKELIDEAENRYPARTIARSGLLKAYDRIDILEARQDGYIAGATSPYAQKLADEQSVGLLEWIWENAVRTSEDDNHWVYWDGKKYLYLDSAHLLQKYHEQNKTV